MEKIIVINIFEVGALLIVVSERIHYLQFKNIGHRKNFYLIRNRD